MNPHDHEHVYDEVTDTTVTFAHTDELKLRIYITVKDGYPYATEIDPPAGDLERCARYLLRLAEAKRERASGER